MAAGEFLKTHKKTVSAIVGGVLLLVAAILVANWAGVPNQWIWISVIALLGFWLIVGRGSALNWNATGDGLVPFWVAVPLAVLWFVVLSVVDLYFLAAVWPHPTPSGGPPQTTTAATDSGDKKNLNAVPGGTAGAVPAPDNAGATTGTTTTGTTTTTATTTVETTSTETPGSNDATKILKCLDCSHVTSLKTDPAEAKEEIAEKTSECECWNRVITQRELFFKDDPRRAYTNDPTCIYIYGFGGWHLIWGETRLLIIVMLSGFLGAMIYSLRSFFWYVGNRKLVVSWLIMYALVPVVGSMMAVVFYLMLRGGLFSPGTTVESTSPFGFAAIAALVGMFIQQSAVKLKTVFEALMAKGETGSDHAPTSSAPAIQVTSEKNPPAGADASVTVTGERFTKDSKILAGTTPLTTTFNNETELTAIIPSAMLATAGAVVQISVQTPGMSPSNVVTITAKGSDPAPASTTPAIQVTSEQNPPAGADAPVTVTGEGFTAESKILAGTTSLTTTFVNETELTATIPSAMLATAGTTVQISVQTPGLSPSNAVTITAK